MVNAVDMARRRRWGSPTLMEMANFVGLDSVASDVSWTSPQPGPVNGVYGVVSVHAATRPAGSPWVRACQSGTVCLDRALNLAASRDGSIAVVGWSPSGPSVNAAVRLSLGAWSSSLVLARSNAKLT